MMTPDIARDAVQFLQTATVLGRDVGRFTQVLRALVDYANANPAPAPKDKPQKEIEDA